MAKRHGSKVARERFTPLRGSFPGADHPLDVIQIDHTPVDLIIVDEVYRKTNNGKAGRVVSVVVIIAVAVNTDGVREILGVATGPSEAEPFWTEFLRGLSQRGLRGVKLVISDAHEGLKAAASKVFKTSWQRCRVHFIRNALAHVGIGQRQAVLAMINTIFVQESGKRPPTAVLMPVPNS